jgi:hypothetical protein
LEAKSERTRTKKTKQEIDDMDSKLLFVFGIALLAGLAVHAETGRLAEFIAL